MKYEKVGAAPSSKPVVVTSRAKSMAGQLMILGGGSLLLNIGNF